MEFRLSKMTTFCDYSPQNYENIDCGLHSGQAEHEKNHTQSQRRDDNDVILSTTEVPVAIL